MFNSEKSKFFHYKPLKLPKIDALDLRRKPFDRLSHRIVSEFQFQDAMRWLTTFLSIDTKPTKINQINDSFLKIGDSIRTIVDSRGNPEYFGNDINPTWTLRLPIDDTDEILALAKNDVVIIMRNSVEDADRRLQYAVYMPRIGQLQNHSHDGKHGSYYGVRQQGDKQTFFYPEKNPRDEGHVGGCFALAKQATRDLLKATGYEG